MLEPTERVGASSVMVLTYDFLDSMAWDDAISGILLAVGSIMLRQRQSKDTVEEKTRSTRIGFAAAGACGLYLFLSGIAISYVCPFTLSSGVHNILFGGIASMGGVVLLVGSAALVLNADLGPVSYLVL
jgi:uncharacterized membrane protein